MQEAHEKKHHYDFDDEIDLIELFHVLLEGKWIIISVTAFVSIIAVIFSLLLPNIYESKALLVPVNSSSNISGVYSSYNSLAGLAGFNLPPRIDDGNTQKAIEKIKTLSFFENNILPNIYLPDLMAFKSWNLVTNTPTYDNDIFDEKSNTWIRDYTYPMQQTPSAQESFKVFQKKHLNLTVDEETGFINISIKHQSPIIAKQWLALIFNEVNAFYRQKDKLESEMAINFLNKQISMTNLSEVRLVLAQLMQEETKKLTLVEANQSYVFDYIDPPVVMELKSQPNRALICILSAIFGGMLSVMGLIIRHYISNIKTL